MRTKAATLSQLALIGYWLLLFIGTHLPATTPFLPGRRFDKFYHALGFALLAVLLATTWTLTFGRVTWRALGIILIALALYAVVDEVTQPIVGRASSLYDWLADMAGAAAGMVVFFALRRKFDDRELKPAGLDEVACDKAGRAQ
jgi:VanZ family protein